MRTTPVVCLAMVVEAVIERQLLSDLEGAGARGWTITPGYGRSDWEGADVRIETVGSPGLIDRLLAVLARVYFPRYALVAWTTPVSVVRPDEFA